MRKNFVLLAAVAPCLVGCAAMLAGRNNEMDQILGSGDFRGAALLAESRLGFDPPAQGDGALAEVTFKKANVLDHLDAAEAWILAGDDKRAIQHFDAAEEALKDVELQGGASQAGKQIGAALANDLVLDYVPSPAESILMNYYKALAFLKEGDAASARVELNRADDRTRRAVERYESEITSAQEEASSKVNSEGYSNPTVSSSINAKFPEFNEWTLYRDFIVPPATYLQALYLGRSKDPGDRQRSSELFKRVIGVADSNEALQQDAAEAANGRVCPADNCTWILIEHGLGPVLEERRMDLTVPTLSSGLLTVSFALPALTSRSGGTTAPPFALQLDAATVTPQPLAEMDRVIQTEYQKRFPGIATRAVISATVKAVAQKTVTDHSSTAAAPLLNLLSNVMTIATTAADTRMWRSMPGRFSLARVSKTSKVPVLRVAGGDYVITVDVPPTGSQLIYIKSVSPTVKPVVEIIKI